MWWLQRDVVSSSKPSPHLSWAEVSCHDGTPYPPEWRKTRLVVLTSVFEDFREYAGGYPLTIGSCFRTPRWNRKQGGAKLSQHVQGRAIDIHPHREMTLEGFHTLAKMFAKEDERVGGLGWYKWGVHIDVRSRERHRLAFWNQIPAGTLLHDTRIA